MEIHSNELFLVVYAAYMYTQYGPASKKRLVNKSRLEFVKFK